MHLHCQRQCGKAQNDDNCICFSEDIFSIARQHFRVPFEWKDPVRYSIVVLVECVWTIYLTVFVGGLLTLAIAAFFFEVVIITDLKNYLNSIDQRFKSQDSHLKISRNLHKFIEIHSMMKQLRMQLHELRFYIFKVINSSPHRIMRELSEISQPFFSVALMASLVLICVSLLLIQMDIVKYCWHF